MLQGYVDDSGSDGLRAPFFLAGYILQAEAWAEFSDEWHTQLQRKPRIEYFKMKEANERTGQFSGMPEEFVKLKIRDLLTVLLKFNPDGVFAQLDWDEYRAILESGLPKAIRNPYHVLFPCIFDAVVDYQRNKEIFPETIDIDFDEQGEIGRIALEIYPRMKAAAPDDIRAMLGRTPTMLDDKTVMPLQAADMFAWNLRREADPADTEKKWHWLYEEIYKTTWLGYRAGKGALAELRVIANSI